MAVNLAATEAEQVSSGLRVRLSDPQPHREAEPQSVRDGQKSDAVKLKPVSIRY